MPLIPAFPIPMRKTAARAMTQSIQESDAISGLFFYRCAVLCQDFYFTIVFDNGDAASLTIIK
jgi:hypothetical protein